MTEDEARGYNKGISQVRLILEKLIEDDRIAMHKRILCVLRDSFNELYITEEDLARVKASEATSD